MIVLRIKLWLKDKQNKKIMIIRKKKEKQRSSKNRESLERILRLEPESFERILRLELEGQTSTTALNISARFSCSSLVETKRRKRSNENQRYS